MGILINKCTNANVYINDTSFLGRAEEVTLPDVSPKMVDHKALGMVGESELPAGLTKMSAKIKWNAIYPDVMKTTHDVFTRVKLMIRTSIETYEGGSRVAQVPAIIFLTGIWKKSGGLSFKPQDNVEIENELNVLAYKMKVGDEEIVDIDVLSNRWSVNGVDQLETYRLNLGV